MNLPSGKYRSFVATSNSHKFHAPSSQYRTDTILETRVHTPEKDNCPRSRGSRLAFFLTLGSTDDEHARWLQMVDCLIVQQVGRYNRCDNLLAQISTQLIHGDLKEEIRQTDNVKHNKKSMIHSDNMPDPVQWRRESHNSRTATGPRRNQAQRIFQLLEQTNYAAFEADRQTDRQTDTDTYGERHITNRYAAKRPSD